MSLIVINVLTTIFAAIVLMIYDTMNIPTSKGKYGEIKIYETL